MNISITGNLGSGKSSVCKSLKEKGYEVISAGSIFRNIAEERGMSVIELNEYAKTDNSIDDLLDSRTTQLSKELTDAVFDCRLGWHFAVDTFKVFIFVDNNEAGRRIYNDNKREAEKYSSVEDACQSLKTRTDLEKERFKDIYGVQYYDISNYNLLIESTYATPDQIADEIIRNYELYKQKTFDQKIEINIRGLLPTLAFRDFYNQTFEEYKQKESDIEGLSACDADNITPIIVQKDGFNFIADGHHRIFAAANTGKVFCTIDRINTNPDIIKNVILPEKSSLYDFEDIGKFSYDWFKGAESRPDYLLDISQEYKKRHTETL